MEAFLERADLQRAQPAITKPVAPAVDKITARANGPRTEIAPTEMARAEMPLSLLVAQAAEEQGLDSGPTDGLAGGPNGGAQVVEASDALAQADRLDATPLFTSIVAREDVRNLLPYNEPVQASAERLGLPLESILVVSDTDSNLRAGRASGMITVGVLNGLGERDDFTDADLILDHVTELAEWL